MKKKIYLTTWMILAMTISTYAASVQEFAAQLKILNHSYILPMLGAGIGIYAIVSGAMKIGAIRKGGEEQTSAIMNWLGSLVWPAVVVVVSEGIIIVFTSLYT